MKHLMYDLGFILRNWRYFHAHHALRAELRDWWRDYDEPPPAPHVYMDYSININESPGVCQETAGDTRETA